MFNSPLSYARAERLIEALTLSDSTILADFGCGDGAFLRCIASKYRVSGVGIDNDAALIEQAAKDTLEASPSSTVRFVCSDASSYLRDMEAVDVIVSIGSEFVFGGYGDLLQQARAHLLPKGRLLVGTVYWKQPPSSDYLALMGGENPHFDLPTTVRMAYEAHYLPLEIQRSSDDEWDTFESHHARKRYLTALQTQQSDLQQRTWTWQSGYLQWGMATMGFCFLVLQKSEI